MYRVVDAVCAYKKPLSFGLTSSKSFQVLFLFLAILATTAIADSHVHEDVEGLVARDAWDDDALFARNDAQLDARDDDELYARDWEEYKDHPLVRELIDVVRRTYQRVVQRIHRGLGQTC